MTSRPDTVTGRYEDAAALPGAAAEPRAAAQPGRAAQRPDTTTFEAAVAPHYPSLVRRLVLVLGNEQDAEDVAQDAFLRAFRSWRRFDGTDVRAWLHTIALRLAFNQLRRRRRWLGILQRQSAPTPWSDQVDPDLWQALRRLDARSRAAFLLNVLDGYTQKEIGGMFGVAEGTVAAWLSRARASVRSDLEDRASDGLL